jgi:acyl-CoA dehydrogenase
VDFALSPRATELQERLGDLMDRHVYPAEATYA